MNYRNTVANNKRTWSQINLISLLRAQMSYSDSLIRFKNLTQKIIHTFRRKKVKEKR